MTNLKGLLRVKYIFVGVFFLFFVWLIGGFFFSNSFYPVFGLREVVRERFGGNISVASPVIPDEVCVISDFGAVSNGEKVYTESIQRAIDTCSERGGGTVIIPAGTWVTGPLELKSKIRLFLEKDARLVFSPNRALYEKGVPNRFEGIEMTGMAPLFSAQDSHDISLAGEGVIDGSGSVWQLDETRRGQERDVFDMVSDMVQKNIPAERRLFYSGEKVARPDMVLFNGCDRVLIEDVSFTNSPRWTVHFLYSKNISIMGTRIDTDGPNTDGIVIDSSNLVRIENVRVHSGDDAIVMKSGLDADGRRVGIPTENVVIRNVEVDGAHGAIVIGSEMSGGVRNILVEGGAVKNAWVVGRINAPKGRGGFVENIVMNDISYEAISRNAIHIDMEYNYNVAESDSVEVENLPRIEKIFFANFHGMDAQRVVDIDGLAENPVRDIVMNKMNMHGEKGVALQNVAGVVIVNSKFDIRLGDIKNKAVFSLENADRIVMENLDCSTTTEKECVNATKNEDRRSLFLTKNRRFFSVQKGNFVLIKYVLFPFHSWGVAVGL